MQKKMGIYQIIGDLPIGQGGMGAVWTAEDTELKRLVAIKLLNPGYLDNETILKRFRYEAKAMARLNHPGIVTVYALIEHEDTFGIVMELIKGDTLISHMRKCGGRILPDEALEICIKVLEALDYAHQKGIVHRDIKPANIMLSDSGHVKVMDFGIAMLVGETRLTQSGSTFGTPHYMSPEQIINPQELDHRSDVYSVGVILFEMLTGVVPFGNASTSDYVIKNEHLQKPLQPIRQLQPDVPEWIETVLNKALQKNPADRFSGCGEFAEALRNKSPVLDSTPQSQAAIQTSNRTSGPSPPLLPFTDNASSGLISAPFFAGGIVFLLVLLICLGTWLLRRSYKTGSSVAMPAPAAATDAAQRNKMGKESARIVALDTLRRGTDLSFTISKLPKLEKVVEAAQKLGEISPRYQEQIDSAKSTLVSAKKERDKNLMVYVGKVVELNRYTLDQSTYAMNAVRNGDLSLREKSVTELIENHLNSLRHDSKADPEKFLAEFTQRFVDFVD